MDPSLVELLSDGLTTLPCSIVRVVDDDLPATVEEVPYCLLTALEDLLPELDGLRAFLSLCQLQRVPGPSAHAARTECEVVRRELLCTSEHLPTIVSQRNDRSLHTGPS